MNDYLATNKELWNQKTAIHIQSKFYDIPSFLNGNSSLNPIELDLLGEISGKKILHLQCHFGQDTLSLARLGAQVTGVDLSDKAIDKAKELAKETQLDARFICCDLQQLDQHLDEKFDIIFTSYGTICWLPKLDGWGAIIAHFLKPEGRFIMAEFHPVLGILDDDFQQIAYPYFNKRTYYETHTTSYTDGGAHAPVKGYCWNHSIADVFQALLKNGLSIQHFAEFDYSPYDCFPNMIATKNGFQINGYEGKLPMVYTVVAEKKTS